MKWNKIITNNFWAKIVALILAIATWFYVSDMVQSDSFLQKKESIDQLFSRYKFTVKEVPVEPVFVGESPAGYKVNFNKLKIIPAKISIFGPRDVVEEIEYLNTDKIYLEEYTRSVRLSLRLYANKRFVKFNHNAVDLFLPIEAEKQ